MKNNKYKTIIRELLESLEDEEKIYSNHSTLIIRIFDDLLYNKKFSDYTIRQFEDIIKDYENEETNK